MSLYQRWMHNRELRLTLRDRHRRIFPFDWGLDWLGSNNDFDPTSDPLTSFKDHANDILSDSDQYYEPPPLRDAVLVGDSLTFATPTPSPHPENNTAHCRLFSAPEAESAVIVVPQWNAQEDSHVGLWPDAQETGNDGSASVYALSRRATGSRDAACRLHGQPQRRSNLTCHPPGGPGSTADRHVAQRKGL